MFISIAVCILCLMTLLLILNRIDLGVKKDIRELKQRVSQLEHSYMHNVVRWNVIPDNIAEEVRFTKSDSTGESGD